MIKTCRRRFCLRLFFYMFLIELRNKSATLPLIPVSEQNVRVKQLILSVIPVIKETRFNANKEPIPDMAERENDEIK